MTILHIAACLYRLGRTKEIDALIDKAKHIYFDAYGNIKLRDYNKTMTHMLEYFTQEYNKYRLNEYKVLDLSEIKKSITEQTNKS